ncbi:MAG TPA: hypothetical protein VG096_23045 [Bryobacteraceae bacterium]|nr:hypothetical protein [Bryobacteraceae bacterium]
MALMMRLAIVICLASTLGFSDNWSGALVNSKCYDSLEGNVNPHDSLSNVDRDRGQEISFCSPNDKTKSFAIVDRDGLRFKLDAGGNTKAAELVRNTGKKPYYRVTVTGEMSKHTIKTDSISMAPNLRQ